MQIWPGQPYPLGATFDGVGTNFSVFSEVAERVELSLFDDRGKETRIDLPEMTALCWHGYVPDVRPGQRYGFRVHGPWDPDNGHWCNPNKVLLDPYAKALDGEWTWNEAVFPYMFGAAESSRNDLDSAPFVPKAIVVNPFFDWGSDRRPNTPWHRTVVYETHVKGFTKCHPEIPEEIRGTYAGMAHPAAVKYLQRLGITAVELLPVHQFVQDSTLEQKGLRNYWGYNSIAYLAPHNQYSRSREGGQVQEFKQLVKTMAVMGLPLFVRTVKAGIEQVDRRYEAAAATLGAAPLRVFLTITLPLALPSVLAGTMLGFARAIGEFGATIVIAGSIPGATRTLAVAIYTFTETGRDADAAVMS